MRTVPIVAVLLVAAALAGCTGGTDKTSQLPTTNPLSSASGSASGSGTGGPRGNGTQPGPTNSTLDAYLEVSATNATAPYNLTMSFGASATDANLTWTLTVTLDTTGNGTGNATGDSTGNSTGNQTSSTGTSTAGNETGNATGNSPGNSTGNSTGNPGANPSGGNGTSGNGTVLAQANGTGADLPGNRSVWLNGTGQARVAYAVTFSDGSVVERNATVNVTGLPPGSPLGQETMHAKGSILLGGTELDCDSVGHSDVPWLLNATHNGTWADVDHLWVNLTGSPSVEDFRLTLLAPNGTEVAHADDNLANEALDLNGTFPAGNYTVHVSACAAVAGSWALDATADYVVARRP